MASNEEVPSDQDNLPLSPSSNQQSPASSDLDTATRLKERLLKIYGSKPRNVDNDAVAQTVVDSGEAEKSDSAKSESGSSRSDIGNSKSGSGNSWSGSANSRSDKGEKSENVFQLQIDGSDVEFLLKAIDTFNSTISPKVVSNASGGLSIEGGFNDGDSDGVGSNNLVVNGGSSTSSSSSALGAAATTTAMEMEEKNESGKQELLEINEKTAASKKKRGAEEGEEEQEEVKEAEEEKEFMDIHPDVRGKILSFLPISDLGRVAQVCSSLSEEVRHSRLWRSIVVTKKMKENAAQAAQREESVVPEIILGRSRILHSISLMGGVELTEDWMTSLTRFHSTLKHLEIQASLANVSLDDNLMRLAVCCTNLTNFTFIDKTIGRITRFTALGFRNAVGAMLKLEDLAIQITNWIDAAICDELLLALTSKPVKRVCLEDQRSELTEAAITTLSGFKFLAHLEIRRCHLDETSATTIRQMQNLESLLLLFVRGWQLNTWLQLLAPSTENRGGISKLRRLEVPVYLGDEALTLLPAACGANLEKLVLHGIELFNDFRSCFCETIDNRLNYTFRKPSNYGIFAVLEGCPRLEHLGILMNSASKDYCNIDFNFALAEYVDRRIECSLKEFEFAHSEDRTSPIFIPIRSTRDGGRPEMKYSSNFLVYMIRNLGRAFGNSLERLNIKEIRSNIVQAESHEGWVSFDKLLESLQFLVRLTSLELSGLDIRMRTSGDEVSLSPRSFLSSTSAANRQLTQPPFRLSLPSPTQESENSAFSAAINTSAAATKADSASAATAAAGSTRASAATYRELIRWKLKNGTLVNVEISSCNIQIIMTSNPMKDKLREMLNSRAKILIDELNSYHVAYDDSLKDDLETEFPDGGGGINNPTRIVQNVDEEEAWDIFAMIN